MSSPLGQIVPAPCFLSTETCRMPLVSGPEHNPPGESFADRLRAAMASAGGISIRRLGREMQERRPRKGGADDWRNALRSYLHGDHVPGPEITRLLAEILGVEVDALATQPRRIARLERLQAERDDAIEQLRKYRERFGPV